MASVPVPASFADRDAMPKIASSNAPVSTVEGIIENADLDTRERCTPPEHRPDQRLGAISTPNRGDTPTKLAQTDSFNGEHPGTAGIGNPQQDAPLTPREQSGEHAEQPDDGNRHARRRVFGVDRQVDDLIPTDRPEAFAASHERDAMIVEERVDTVEFPRCVGMPAEIVKIPQDQSPITDSRGHG